MLIGGRVGDEIQFLGSEEGGWTQPCHGGGGEGSWPGRTTQDNEQGWFYKALRDCWQFFVVAKSKTFSWTVFRKGHKIRIGVARAKNEEKKRQ